MTHQSIAMLEGQAPRVPISSDEARREIRDSFNSSLQVLFATFALVLFLATARAADLCPTCEIPAATRAQYDAARAALAARDEDGISEAIDLLNKFIDLSRPAQAWSTDLDDHAREALGQLALDIATATNEDLASRTEELRRIAKAVTATAANNEQAAGNIRHEKLIQALTSVMDTARAAKELQAVVQDNPDDKKIADAAEALLKTIAAFKDVLGKADSGQ